jgi:hypothetical protein
MPTIPLPSAARSLAELTQALDAVDHPTRVDWSRQLGRREQLALYALAEGSALRVDDMVDAEGVVVIHTGRNGLALFNRFEKRFARQGDEIVGYNHNDGLGGPFNFIARRIVGPGHYVAYDAPDGDGVWVDYRRLPMRRHPSFPPLLDNDRGLRSLVFGNMVDVIRRVSKHVTIGDAFKNKSPPRTLGSRVGSWFPTAPFVLVRP